MHDLELPNYYIADELPDNDAILQEILDFSFNQYQNNEEDYDLLNGDMEDNVNSIFANATTTNITATAIDNIFTNKYLKKDECSICVNNEKLMKCYHCIGHICKLCTTKIYKRGNSQLKCPFCNQQLDLAQLDTHNRNIYSSNKKIQNKINKHIYSPQYNKSMEDQEPNVEERNMLYAMQNCSIYNDSEYNSGSSDIESFNYNEEKDGEYTYLEPKIGFTTSMYGDNIEIVPFNKNRKKIIFSSKLYNCKYILILYLILIRFKCNNEWNDFITRFKNQMKCDHFKCSNYKKKFLWNTYLDILCY